MPENKRKTYTQEKLDTHDGMDRTVFAEMRNTNDLKEKSFHFFQKPIAFFPEVAYNPNVVCLGMKR